MTINRFCVILWLCLLALVITHAKANGNHVGGWLDTDNGSYYFDSVRIFPEDSLEYAIQFGRENGQIAVFVLSKQLIIKQPFE